MNSAFIQALADAHIEEAVNLQTLRQQCLAAITSGQGSIAFTTTASLNGKQAAQDCMMPPDKLLAAIGAALNIVNGTDVGFTYADFSDLR